MSLNTRIFLTILTVMVLIVGLLTINLLLETTERYATERTRQAEWLTAVVTDWLQSRKELGALSDGVPWGEINRTFSHFALLEGWRVAGRYATGGERAGLQAGTLRLLASSHPATEGIDPRDEPMFHQVLDKRQTAIVDRRVYTLLPTAWDETFVLRLDFLPPAGRTRPLPLQLLWIAGVMTIGTLLLLLSVYVLLYRLVLRPIAQLDEASRRVAAGDLEHIAPLPEPPRMDEIGRLIRAYNLMVERTREHHRTLQEEIRMAREKIHQTEKRLFAAQRLTTTGTLAAGLAHEINNPLGGLLNAVRSLKEDPLDDAKRAEYLDLVLEGLERIRGTVQKVLQFAPRSLEYGPVPLAEAAARAISLVDHRLKSKQVVIDNELTPDLPPAWGDPVEIQQVFINLLLNANDAVVIGEGKIRIAGVREGDMIKVSISDNGCGMTEEQRERCLDPFYTTKEVGEGTGLGLSIVHNIVEHHGGRVEIESSPGEGTAIRFTVPAAPPPGERMGG